MSNTKPDSTAVDQYLSNVPEPQRKELERIRAYIQQTVPDTEETMSYAMPTFKYKGKNLIHYAAFKDHMSIFPTSEPITELKDELANYETGKGTLQFTLEKPFPDDLLRELLAHRVQSIDNK